MAKGKKKVEEVKNELNFKAPTINDLEVIIRPVITEKSMNLMQSQNKATFEVSKNANKIQIKNAVEKIFKVKVEKVAISNVIEKQTTRGSRYKGVISGYKKAIVTIATGEAIDLFKE